MTRTLQRYIKDFEDACKKKDVDPDKYWGARRRLEQYTEKLERLAYKHKEK